MKKIVGFIGWRGMVGSVLLQRMIEENNIDDCNLIFFSTSNVGSKAPIINKKSYGILNNAYDVDLLINLDIIITCQGSKYTQDIYPKLKKLNWLGYWVDASSLLRMEKESIIVLDPVNSQMIVNSINKGIKTFIGGNCTVSLMLMALGGLFQQNLIEWISVSTYQAASGCGSAHMLELLTQMGVLYNSVSNDLINPFCSGLNIERIISKIIKTDSFPVENFSVPLATSLIPWIDVGMNNGQTREEWKGEIETNKILGSKKNIPIDGICVRVGSLRCHSQSFTIKLKQNISILDIEKILNSHNEWVSIIDNTCEDTIHKLTPIAVSGTLNIPVGRVKKLSIGSNYVSIFSVGDQLLWGAAEPLRRMLMLLLKNL